MRTLVLLSGGLDSLVAAWWALDRGDDVIGLTLDYFQRPPPEKRAVEAIAEAGGFELLTAELPWMRELEDPPHPKLDNPALEDAPYGYVPARNAILYAVAAHHAEIVGAERIVGGHNGTDPERFPDASPSFFEDLEAVLQRGLASGMRLEIEQPLHGQRKEEIVEKGLELGAPLELSWSCYELGPDPCGVCPSCERRAEAFENVGVEDPGPALALRA